MARLSFAQATVWSTVCSLALDGLLRSAGKGLGLPTELVELDKVVDHALSNLAGTIEEAGARVDRKELPTVCGEFWQLVEVFEHLLANAIKFRGADPPVIRIGAQEGAQEHLISVKDNGGGIDPTEHARIFTVFGRFTEGGSMSDSGFGLAIWLGSLWDTRRRLQLERTEAASLDRSLERRDPTVV